MRILLVNTFYYPKFIGGAEVSVQLLAENLVRAGNEVYVLTTGPKNMIYRVNGVIVIAVKQLNIFSTYYGTAGRLPFLKMLWHIIDSANVFYHLKVSAILKKIKPDVAHTNNIQGFSPFIWHTIKKQGIKLVHTLRDYYLVCHKCNMFSNNKNCSTLCKPCSITQNIKSRFTSYPDCFVGISNYVLKMHHDQALLQESTSCIIYNGVQLPPMVNQSPVASPVTIGYIGRITADKGVEYLVNEVSALSGSIKGGFRMVFAGKGDEHFINALKQKLTGIDHAFLGVIQPEEFYKQIDILIVPALWNEPFGRTVIEALSYSVPVCQSDRGALKEIYDPESSWLFSPDEGNLTALLTNVLSDKEQIALKKKNCAGRMMEFSVEGNTNKYLGIYGQLIYASKSKAGEVPALQNEDFI